MSWDRDGLFHLYVNGVDVGGVDASADQDDFQLSGGFQIGYDNFMPNNWFEGIIDEVKVYNAAITPAEDPGPPSQRITWSYDDPNISNSEGRLTKVTDLAGSETYQYDELGRVTEQVRTIGGNPYTMQQTWNALSKLKNKTFPDGDEVTYRYNLFGWLRSIETGPFDYIVDFVTYNARGQITEINYGNFLDSDRVYDDDQAKPTFRLKTMTTDGVQDLEYEYDAKGNVTQITDYIGTASRAFEYDNLWEFGGRCCLLRLMAVANQANGVLT